MKTPADLMHREPREGEQETVRDVLAMAVEWLKGDLPTDQVRTLCTGRERMLAVACARPGSVEKRALLALLDALIATTPPPANVHSIRNDDILTRDILINISAGKPDQPATYVTRQELAEMGFVLQTNWRGQRVWVSPMHWVREQPVYPQVDREPGDTRRSIEAKMAHNYTQYRKEKHHQ
jgi:hypothetical protein